MTNDDGIFSKGIESLYQALSMEHEVTVVAPETEQSAVGHAITLLEPLRVNRVKRNGHFFGFALKGTPADCVKIAVTELLTPPPQIVVSGINLGANVGVNVIYSGTVSAATEAAVLGIPSIAVSIDSANPVDFSAATEFIPRLVAKVATEGLPGGVSLNVNVPNIPAEKVRGVRLTRQGRLQCVDRYDRRTDPRNNAYYWLCNLYVEQDRDPDVDSNMLAAGFITVTPIHYDLTEYEMLKTMEDWDLGL